MRPISVKVKYGLAAPTNCQFHDSNESIEWSVFAQQISTQTTTIKIAVSPSENSFYLFALFRLDLFRETVSKNTNSVHILCSLLLQKISVCFCVRVCGCVFKLNVYFHVTCTRIKPEMRTLVKCTVIISTGRAHIKQLKIMYERANVNPFLRYWTEFTRDFFYLNYFLSLTCFNLYISDWVIHMMAHETKSNATILPTHSSYLNRDQLEDQFFFIVRSQWKHDIGEIQIRLIDRKKGFRLSSPFEFVSWKCL